MKKIIVMLLVLALMAPMAASPVFAAMNKTGKGIENVGNKMCAMEDGAAVDGKTFAVHNGKRYGFCCSKCKKEFLKDPEKYIAKMKAGEKDLKR